MGRKADVENSVMLVIGVAMPRPSDHNIMQFTVAVYNDVDLLPGKVNGEYNEENTPGYLSKTSLKDILEVIRSNIDTCFHHTSVTCVIKEEDSK